MGQTEVPCEVPWGVTLPLTPAPPGGTPPPIKEASDQGIIGMATNGVPLYGPRHEGRHPFAPYLCYVIA